jgi:hypothetical protein
MYIQQAAGLLAEGPAQEPRIPSCSIFLHFPLLILMHNRVSVCYSILSETAGHNRRAENAQHDGENIPQKLHEFTEINSCIYLQILTGYCKLKMARKKKVNTDTETCPK